MKRFSMIALIVILMLSSTACSPGTDSSKANDAADKTANQDAARDFVEKVDPDTLKWPKERLHPDMPEFKKGKMNPWAGDNYEIYTLIHEISKEDVTAYEKELVAAGFTVESERNLSHNDSVFTKDLYKVTIALSADNSIELRSYKEQTTDWPEALSAIPPIGAGDLVSADAPEETTPGSMQLYYINLPKEKLKEWRKTLSTKGFNVEEDTMKAENISFNGKTYAKASIWYEENGTNEWNVYFEFEN